MAWKYALAAGIPCIMTLCGLALAADNQAFISDAIKGDNSEIALGRLAAAKGGKGVKEFGQTLLIDHLNAKKDATALAKKLGVKPPQGITVEAASENYKLQGLSGAAFDKEFALYMTEGHEKAISMYEKEANTGGRDTADLARKTLPTLKKHLAIAEKLNQSS